MGAVLEVGGHHGVHRDHHVSLLRHQLVPVLDLLGNPFLEGLIDDCSAHVDDPLLRRLREVLVVGEEGFDVGNVGDELENLLNCQRLVLGHVEMLDLVVLEMTLLLVQHVFEKIDRGVVCRERTVSEGRKLDLPYGGRYT